MDNDFQKATYRFLVTLLCALLIAPSQARAYSLNLGLGGVTERTEINGDNRYINGATVGLGIHFKLWDHKSFEKSSNSPISNTSSFLNINSSYSTETGIFLVFAVLVLGLLVYGIFYVLALFLSYQIEFGLIGSYDHHESSGDLKYSLGSFGFGFRMFPLEQLPVYFGGYISSITASSKNLESGLIHEEQGYQRKAVAGLMSYDRQGFYLEFSWETNHFERPAFNAVPDSIKSVLPVGRDRKSVELGYSITFD